MAKGQKSITIDNIPVNVTMKPDTHTINDLVSIITSRRL